MHFYKTLLHVSGISIVEILFYFYYIGPLETDIFTKEFKSLINSMNSDFSNNENFLSFQEIYKEHYQYNETAEKILIEKQNKSLEEMELSVNDAIYENEEYNHNLLIQAVIYWICFNVLIILIYLLENNIDFILRKNTKDSSTSTGSMDISISNIELLRLNKRRSSSIDEEDLTYIENINNNNNKNLICTTNNTNNNNNNNNVKKTILQKCIQNLALASTLLGFQYVFINYIVLKYHILTIDELKYMLYKQIYPIFNNILFPPTN
jgi:hypothetical protein